MPRLHGNHIVCDACGDEFIGANSQEHARAEADMLWSKEELEAEGEGIICDPCFKKLMKLLGRDVGES